jgi:putative transposase
VNTFANWYNDEHRHSGNGFVTPGQRHKGLDGALLLKRTDVYEAAKARHPEGWSGAIRKWEHIALVHLNPESSTQMRPKNWGKPAA